MIPDRKINKIHLLMTTALHEKLQVVLDLSQDYMTTSYPGFMTNANQSTRPAV